MSRRQRPCRLYTRVGHLRTCHRPENCHANDRFQRPAAIGEGGSKVLILQSSRTRSYGAGRHPTQGVRPQFDQSNWNCRPRVDVQSASQAVFEKHGAAIRRLPCCSREPCTNRTAPTTRVVPCGESKIFGRHTLSLVEHVHGAGTSGLKRACIASLPRSRNAILRIADGSAVRFSARAML